MADKSIVVFYKVSVLSDLPATIESSILVDCASTDNNQSDLNKYCTELISSESITKCRNMAWNISVSGMKKTKRQVVLNKGSEKFIFRYDSGCEDKLLEVLVEQAKDKRTNFDWFDAAVVSFKLTQSLIGQADELLRENKDAQINSG